MKLNSFWDQISAIGVRGDMPEKERVKVSIINQLCLVTLFISSVFLTAHSFTASPEVYDDLITVFFVLIIFFLQHNKWHQTARHLTCWLFPVAVIYMVVRGERDFGQASVFIVCAILSFIQYEEQPKLRIISVVYTWLMGLLASLYLVHYVPAVTDAQHPYDKTITYCGILVIGILIVYFYQKDINKYQRQKRKLIEKLEAKNKELVQLNTELDQFTYIASHDLKSPLRNVISFSDLLEMKLKRGNYDDAYELLGYIKSGAKQMKYLIEDILEMSRLNNNDNNEKELVDLNELVSSSQQALMQEIHEKNAQIITGFLPEYFCNKIKVSVLFQNLIQNGIKYNTSARPTIEIWAVEKPHAIYLYFKDNGIGIAPAFHKKIFEFFKRLHNTNEYEGTGIGLGLCNKIVQHMGGAISVESEVGKGSKFVVELPIVPVPTPVRSRQQDEKRMAMPATGSMAV